MTNEFDEKNTVLVIGATGDTGKLVVSKLAKRGIKVRALYRTNTLDIQNVEYVKGDVRDLNSLKLAFEGVHTVISCLGNRKYYGKGGMNDVDVNGSKNLIQLSKENKVKHFILLSSFGIERKSIFLDIFSIALNKYFYFKELVEKLVINSGIPFTVIRPHELRNREPLGLPFINQTMPLGLIMSVSRETVAEVLTSCVFEDKVKGAVFEVVEGGKETLTDQFNNLNCDGKLHLTSNKTPIISKKI